MTKFDSHLLFNPVWKKFRPPYLFSRPPHLQKISTPTSILTIRSLVKSSVCLSPVFELSKRRWGGRNFSLGGGLRDVVGGSKFFFDTGLKKRWGVENYTINQVYGVRNRFKGAHTVCHTQYLIIISRAPIRFVLLFTAK